MRHTGVKDILLGKGECVLSGVDFASLGHSHAIELAVPGDLVNNNKEGKEERALLPQVEFHCMVLPWSHAQPVGGTQIERLSMALAV